MRKRCSDYEVLGTLIISDKINNYILKIAIPPSGSWSPGVFKFLSLYSMVMVEDLRLEYQTLPYLNWKA
jgi:hypothetical protein